MHFSVKLFGAGVLGVSPDFDDTPIALNLQSTPTDTNAPPPTVSISIDNGTRTRTLAYRDGLTLPYTLTLSSALTAPLEVGLDLGGSQADGSLATTRTTVTLAPGGTSYSIGPLSTALFDFVPQLSSTNSEGYTANLRVTIASPPPNGAYSPNVEQRHIDTRVTNIPVTPVISIAPTSRTVARNELGGDLTFTLKAEPVPAANVEVALTVSNGTSEAATLTRTFPRGQATVDITVPTDLLQLPKFDERHTTNIARTITITTDTSNPPAYGVKPAPDNAAQVTVTPPPNDNVAWMSFIKKVVDAQGNAIAAPAGSTPFRFTVTGDTNRFEFMGVEGDRTEDIPGPTATLQISELNTKTRPFSLYAGSATFTELIDPASGITLKDGDVSCENTKTKKTFEPAVTEGRFTIDNIVHGDEFDCTITNTYTPVDPPTVVIVKQIPSDSTGTFKFKVTGDGIPTPLTPELPIDATDNGVAFTNPSLKVPAGVIVITEERNDDYRLDSVRCVQDAGPKVDFTPDIATQSVTVTIPTTGGRNGPIQCTFVNEPRPEPPTVTIVKEVKGLTESQAFLFTVSGAGISEPETKAVSVDAATGRSSPESSPTLTVEQGQVTIKETVPDGFTFDKASCVLGNVPADHGTHPSTATVNVLVPETGDIICTIKNKKIPPPTLTIRKIVETKGDQTAKLPETFSFTFAEQVIGEQTIKVETVNQFVEKLPIEVKAGALIITEGDEDNFRADRASCTATGQDLISIFNNDRRELSLTVPKTGDVVCTFVNVPVDPPTLIIEKTANAKGDFAFRISGDGQPTIPNPTIRIAAANQTETTDPFKVEQGAITIAEVDLEGFNLKPVSCRREGDAQDLLTITDHQNNSVNFTMPKTGQVTCKFTNLTPPTLIIEKVVTAAKGYTTPLPRDFSFTFGGQKIDERIIKITKTGTPVLTPSIAVSSGTLTITEGEDADYNLQKASCRVGDTTFDDLIDNTLTLNVPETGEVRCTFTNVPANLPPTLVVRKIVKEPANDTPFAKRTFTFNLLGLEPKSLPIPVTQRNTVFSAAEISLEGVEGFAVAEVLQDGYRLDTQDDRFGCRVNGKEGPIGEFDGTSGFAFGDSDLNGLAAAAQVVCTFVNVPPPTLIVEKVVTAVDGFTTPLPRDFSFTFGEQTIEKRVIQIEATSKPKATDTIAVTTGALTITEGEDEDYDLQGASCQVGKNGEKFGTLTNGVLKLDIPKTGEVRCTFNNVPANLPPTLIVEKIVTAVDGYSTPLPHDFSFTFGGQTIEPKTIKVEATGILKATDTIAVTTGALTITEGEDEDYNLQSATCRVGDDKATIGELANGVLALDIPKTGEVRCTFVNVPSNQPPTLIVEKVVTAVDGFSTPLPRKFAFTFGKQNIGEQRIEIRETGTTQATSALVVSGGALTITEAEDSDYNLQSASCRVGGNEETFGRLTGRLLTLDVPKTGEVRCRFTNVPANKPPPELIYADVIIKKVTRGGVGTFAFNLAADRFTTRQTITTVATNDARGKDAAGAGQTETISVPVGGVTIAEEKHRKFKFVSATCDGGAPTADAAARRVAFTLVEGATVTCTFVNREIGDTTITIITDFLYRRAQQLLGDTGRPRLIERQRAAAPGGSLKDALGVRGEGSLKDGNVSFRTSLRGATGDQTDAKARRLGVRAADFGVASGRVTHRPGWDVWTEGRINYFRSDATYDGVRTSGHFGVARIGTDYLVTPRFLVGFLAQYDSIEERSKSADGHSISGRGFMIGPYAEYQLSNGLYFDAKVLWGKSTNDISPFNTYTDRFGTTRWLAAARLVGSWDYQVSRNGAVHFSPRAEVAYFSERSESYTDSNDIHIAGQEVNLGRVTIGPEVSYRYIARDGTRVEPRVAIKALWSFGSGDPKGLDPAFTSSVSTRKEHGFGVQVSGGLALEAPSGYRIDLQGDYTGLGRSKEHAAGGKINVTIPLQQH